MTAIIPTSYQGQEISFNEDGWFNATEAATRFGKRPVDWLALDSTKEYISTLAEISNCEKSSLLKARRGRYNNGTWFHPKLAVPFARWLDVRFAIWCDLQIDQIIRGTHLRFDWKKLRSKAAASFKVMNEALRIVREGQGKQTAARHYINEARLINFVLCGQFTSLDREALSDLEMDLLAGLETRNAVLVGQGFDYQTRKASLRVYATERMLSLPPDGAAHQPALMLS